MQSMRRRVGPVGLSLLAAAVTATAFAAVSVAAKDDGGKAEKGSTERGQERGFEMRLGPPPALSDEDQAKLEEFRQCMEDNGAPAPPDPSEMRKRPRDGDMPEPPSEEEMEKIQKAHEACADKLPEGLDMHFGGPGGPGCGRAGGPGGPPPGVQEGTAVPAPPSGGSQGDAAPAPQGSTS